MAFPSPLLTARRGTGGLALLKVAVHRLSAKGQITVLYSMAGHRQALSLFFCFFFPSFVFLLVIL